MRRGEAEVRRAPSRTVVGAALTTLAACAGSMVSRPVDVAVAGVGAPVYRIPALAVTTRGTLLAAFDARASLADLPSYIVVAVRRSTDQGRTFGPAMLVRADTAPYGYGDPSFIVDRTTGRVFLFYAASVRQGFAGSHAGVSEDDPDVLQADLSWSDDDGLTWQHRRITRAIKRPEWGGIFAASGEGIQLRSGPFAGRLIQQYVVRWRGANWAVSVWSDDHGSTWHAGALAGPGADENKAVELDDGRLLLNVRARPWRKRAWSSDGGATWSALTDDSSLADPGNNGSIIPAGGGLLLSHTASPTERVRLTLALSCDSGMTWPFRRVVVSGSAGYSTMTPLPDGRIGLLYERDHYRRISYLTFEPRWVGTCPGGSRGSPPDPPPRQP